MSLGEETNQLCFFKESLFFQRNFVVVFFKESLFDKIHHLFGGSLFIQNFFCAYTTHDLTRESTDQQMNQLSGNTSQSLIQGKVDKGETELAAAERETKEETSLMPHQYNIIQDFKRTLRYPVPTQTGTRQKRVELWLAELKDTDAEVKLSEHQKYKEHDDFKWLTLDQALKTAPQKNQQQVCREAQLFIERYL